MTACLIAATPLTGLAAQVPGLVPVLGALLLFAIALATVVVRGGRRGHAREQDLRSASHFLNGTGSVRAARDWGLILIGLFAAILIIGVLVVRPGNAPPTTSNKASLTATPALISLTPTPTPAAQAPYTVAPGDTMFAIAARFGVTVTALMEANKLSNADQLTAGQALVIPPKGP